jgi:hypothetical protein
LLHHATILFFSLTNLVLHRCASDFNMPIEQLG